MDLDELHSSFVKKVRAVYGQQREDEADKANVDAYAGAYDEYKAAVDRGQGKRIEHLTSKEMLEAARAAKLYCIARDEGAKAAMMWKLAN